MGRPHDMSGFYARGAFNIEILQTYKFVCAIWIFVCALGFWLRFGVVKSENEFAAAPPEHTTGLVHEVEIFENRKFALKLKLWHV